MASITLAPQKGWAVGETISVYARDARNVQTGSAVTTAAVGANSTVAFTGLADDTKYVATDGTVAVQFSTLTDPSEGGLPPGGDVGDTIINTGDGEGEWAPPEAGVTMVTKRVRQPITGETSQEVGAALDVVNRVEVLLPVTTTRWRIWVRNFTTWTETPHTGAIFMNGAVVGPMSATPGTGDRWNGQFASAPSAALGAQTLGTTGNDVATAWVTDPALQFQAYEPLGLSFGLNSNAVSIDWAYEPGRALGWWNSGAAPTFANTAAPTGSAVTHGALDCRLEYEFSTPETGGTPVTLFIGDSITAGNIAGVLVSFPHDSWAGSAALRNGHAWINAGIGGATTADWVSGTGRWARLDLATTIPDVCVISLGTNDMTVGTSAADAEDDMIDLIAMVRALGIENIYLATQIPRNLGATEEAQRVILNNWIASRPVRTAGVFDHDALLASETAPDEVKSANYILTAGSPYTDPHPKYRGHQVMAGCVVLPR